MAGRSRACAAGARSTRTGRPGTKNMHMERGGAQAMIALAAGHQAPSSRGKSSTARAVTPSLCAAACRGERSSVVPEVQAEPGHSLLDLTYAFAAAWRSAACRPRRPPRCGCSSPPTWARSLVRPAKLIFTAHKFALRSNNSESLPCSGGRAERRGAAGRRAVVRPASVHALAHARLRARRERRRAAAGARRTASGGRPSASPSPAARATPAPARTRRVCRTHRAAYRPAC